MAAHRTMKLMSPAVSDLPRFLTPQGRSRTGFATVQKTIAALEAEIRHLALPASLGVLPVADGIEDHASMAPAVVAKTGEIVERLCWLTAIELAAAAQAVDLRGPIVLGTGTHAVHAFVRGLVAPLDEDRSQGPDFERLAQSIAVGAAAAGRCGGRLNAGPGQIEGEGLRERTQERVSVCDSTRNSKESPSPIFRQA